MTRAKKVSIPILIMILLLLPVLLLLPSVSVSAQGLDFLPGPVRQRIEEVEAARVAWEARRTEVINRLTIQQWEEEEEFARRVERAVARGAGREYRYLQFQLTELEQYTFNVDPSNVILNPEVRPGSGRPWTMQIRTDLGFLPERDEFVINLDPVEREGARADHYELVRAIENSALRGRLSYVLGGYPDGRYRVTLERLYLTDSSRPGPAFRTVPVNRHYVFSRYEAIAVTQPSIRYAFLDGTMPEAFRMSGAVPWSVVEDHAYSGDYVLRAGAIDHDAYSEARLPLAVPTGAANARISFAVRTSSERRYDFLGFYLDDELLGEWSGPGDWIPASYEVELAGRAGIELRWRYEKDGSVSEGEDTVWIDDIQIEFD